MNIRIILALIITLSAGCARQDDKAKTSLSEGTWRAVLDIQDQQVPFNFEVQRDSSGSYHLYVLNAQERLHLDEVQFRNDSVIIPMHIFDASIHAKVEERKLRGVFMKHYEKDYRIPFEAVHGADYRFERGTTDTPVTFDGKYRVRFFEDNDTVDAVGIFQQRGDTVTGTFLTPTGDYRYLEGNVVDDTLKLSTFDGNYVYLFHASKVTSDSISGRFYSGKTKNVLWTGVKDANATLPDESTYTYLKKGYDKIEFAFPDLNGDTVRMSDGKYRNKVVILQLFGTWCPNCMDETRFLAPWYDKHKSRGVEIIGLAYERKPDFAYASARVKRMIEKLDVHYDFVIAGTNDKEKASLTLPMLNKVAAFPTTIFIGKDGKVKKIHSGFSGPGTGAYYDRLIEDFNQTVNALLSEGNAQGTAKL
jgi:thiol-disulfide isomerase/thioredoxin